MKDQERSDYLDHALRQALADEPESQAASTRVVTAVMSQVRGAAADRPVKGARFANLLTVLLAAGLVLAWAGVRISLSLWPGLAGFLRAPAVDAVGNLFWWALQKAGGTLLLLISYSFGSLLTLALLGCLALVPLVVRYTGRSAS